MGTASRQTVRLELMTACCVSKSLSDFHVHGQPALLLSQDCNYHQTALQNAATVDSLRPPFHLTPPFPPPPPKAVLPHFPRHI